MTNIGIVLPEPGYLAAVRELTRAYGTLLINDETHTFSAGPGGCTQAWRLDPDLVTIGKSIGGGIACGAYGLSGELAAAILADESADIVDTGGVGGTLAGSALSVAAMRATLEQVLTPNAFTAMIGLAERSSARAWQGYREVRVDHGARTVGHLLAYGQPKGDTRWSETELIAALRGFRRQALHAERLSFIHPVSGEALSFSAERPAAPQALIEALRQDLLVPGAEDY